MRTSIDLGRALRLVVITDRARPYGPSIESIVTQALEGGCRCVQLRDKMASARSLMERARRLRELTAGFGALLILNDRFDIALASEADGVHVGPDDVPVHAIRAQVPDSFVIGASCDRPEEARRLVAAGANYLGCGTVYPTATKPDAGPAIGIEGVRALVEAVDVPVVAIGGIDAKRVRALAGSGASGIAVVGAVMGATNPQTATRELLAGFDP